MDVIERTLSQDKDIYTATMAIISGMKEGTNKAMDDMTEEVALAVLLPASHIKPMVGHFAHATEEDGIGYVAPGRFGGYRKGVRPEKKLKKTIDVVADIN